MRTAAVTLAAIMVALWAANSSWLVQPASDAPLRLLAHRGLHQIYTGDVLDNDTCTARPIRPPSHGFIENTLRSMKAAFDAGAEVVELDIHLTPDDVFAVFHDWTLDCRTDAAGQTNETPFATLRTLDLGYGYSVDGVTFPLRGGAGVGAMPTLSEVFDTFPDGRFLINFKSNRAREGAHLAQMLTSRPDRLRRVFGVYGGGRPTETLRADLPDIPGFTNRSVRDCLTRYAALGWSSHVPTACRDTILAVPVNYAPFLWGWPHRFTNRMDRAGTEVILVGPFTGGRRVRGIDTPEDAGRVPDGFAGLVWTNDLPAITPHLR